MVVTVLWRRWRVTPVEIPLVPVVRRSAAEAGRTLEEDTQAAVAAGTLRMVALMGTPVADTGNSCLVAAEGRVHGGSSSSQFPILNSLLVRCYCADCEIANTNSQERNEGDILGGSYTFQCPGCSQSRLGTC
ncbi:hypothetical protein M0R45_033891 [Rubus argutus]|uniref:Uncharacterized protein n=1 Tax=Rubus argutus TaxID=59490 RepID=A0AAW1WND4_RUBAR